MEPLLSPAAALAELDRLEADRLAQLEAHAEVTVDGAPAALRHRIDQALGDAPPPPTEPPAHDRNPRP
jgi:hypothetical protein